MRRLPAITAATLLWGGAAGAQDDSLWIADTATKHIYHVSLDGELLAKPFRAPTDVTADLSFDAATRTLWGAADGSSSYDGRIVNFTTTGEELVSIDADDFGADRLEGVSLDFFAGHTLWAVDDPDPSPTAPHPTIHHIDEAGNPITSFPTPADAKSPQAIAVDPFDGTLWITDNSLDGVYHLERDGSVIGFFPSDDYDRSANNPQGISVDVADGSLWITDRTTDRIYNVTTSGELLFSFHSYDFGTDSDNPSPTAVAFQPASDEPPFEAVQVRDDFEVASFSNQDGTHDWSTDWIETDAAGAGPTRGNVRVRGGTLVLENRGATGVQPGVEREADLRDAPTAVLELTFRTTRGVDPDDAASIEISPDGGASWQVLEVISGITGKVRESRQYDVSHHAYGRTRVRVRIAKGYDGSKEWFRVNYIELQSRSDR